MIKNVLGKLKPIKTVKSWFGSREDNGQGDNSLVPSTSERVALVIPAAGLGARFVEEREEPQTFVLKIKRLLRAKVRQNEADNAVTERKQFHMLDGKPVLIRTLENLMECYDFCEVVIGVLEADVEHVAEMILLSDLKTSCRVVVGGSSRFTTVQNCLKDLDCDYVCIHDGVRPFVSGDVVKNVIASGIKNGAAVCGLYSRDTVKHVDDGKVVDTVNRDNIFMVHTPQVFSYSYLLSCIGSAVNVGVPFESITDESSVVTMAGGDVYVTPSHTDNIKITYREDIPLVDYLTQKYFGGE